MGQTIDLIVSVVLGISISILFKLCSDSRSCVVYRAPVDKVLRYENKCYKPTERSDTCDSKKTIVDVNE